MQRTSLDVLPESPNRDLVQRLFEHAVDAISILTMDGTVYYQSPSVERTLGYTVKEMIGRSITDFIHPDDRSSFMTFHEGLQRSESDGAAVTCRFLHRDGTVRHLESTGVDLLADPAVAGIVIYSRDVTVRIVAEEDARRTLSSLREREEIYRVVSETASDPIISIDETGTMLFVNKAAERTFGYSQEEMLGSHFAMLMPESQRAFWVTALGNYLDTGIRTLDWNGVSLFGLCKDGREIPVEMSFGSYCEEGKRIFTGIIRDVTEHRRLQSEREELYSIVEKERERLASILRTIPIAIWESESEPGGAHRTTFINEHHESLLGYTLEEWTDTPDFWLKLVHPDDADRITNGRSAPPTSSVIHDQFRMIAKDGRTLWLDTRLVLLFDEDGLPVGTIGFSIDITDRVLAEEAVRLSERRYRSLATATAQTVWVIDATGNVHEEGGDLRSKLGIAAEEEMTAGNVTKAWLETIHPDDIDGVRAAWQKAHVTQQPYEMCYRMKIGEDDYITILARGVPVFDDNGALYEWIGTGTNITEQRRAELALRESEERLRVAIMSSPIMVYSQDRDLLYTWHCNSAFSDSSGVDVRGLCDEDLFCAEEAEELTRLKRQVVETGVGIRREVRLTIDQSVRYFDLTVEPVRNTAGEITGITAAAMDITDRRRAEEALRVSEERYRRIVETTEEGITVVDIEGRIGFANSRTAEMFGYTVEELTAMTIFDLIPHDSIEISQHLLARSNSGEPMQFDMKLVSKEGRTIWCLISTAPLHDEEGNVVGGLGMMTDITERKRAEDALQQAHDQLEARVLERTAELADTMHRLKEAYANQKRFIADASHDIRTPLTSVRAELDLLLLSDSLDPQVHNVLVRVTQQIKRLGMLTDDLLMLAILDSNQMFQCSEVVRVDELILQAIVDLSPLASEHDVSWNITFDDLIEIHCAGAPLKRALANVLQNAVKYSRPGTVIDAHLEGDDRSATIVVRDRGVGINPEDLPHIFDRFYRGDQTRSTEGTGLGLAIVKAVIDGHGGTIEIDSTPGVGTTLTITLPR